MKNTLFLLLMSLNPILFAQKTERFFSNRNPKDSTGMIKDEAGNKYETLLLPNGQVWMKTNLKSHKLTNGNSIEEKIAQTDWTSNEKLIYYNGYYNASVIRLNSICPSGWRIPSNEDWRIFIKQGNIECDHLEEQNIQMVGNKTENPSIKEHDKTISPFAELLNGFCDSVSDFNNRGNMGYWWTSSLNYVFFDGHQYKIATSGPIENKGFSIRCIKN